MIIYDYDLSQDDDMDIHSDFCLITYHKNDEYDESNDYFHDFENTYENENTNVYETAMEYEGKILWMLLNIFFI